MHEGISTPCDVVGTLAVPDCLPVPLEGGCPRWPQTLRLVNGDGELVAGRCRATNQCAYCARLAAVENAEMLALDAEQGCPPTIVAILGTADAVLDPKPFYRSREKLMKVLQRRWPDAQYAALVEFTTGYAARAGGRRRPHWNLLLKGIPLDDLAAAEEVILSLWCARERAQPTAQYVAPVAEVGGLMRYLAFHFLKESQSPPHGWKGHRFLKSRGYLWLPTPEAREQARLSLRRKRALYAARLECAAVSEAEGVVLGQDEVFRLAESRLRAAEAATWHLWRSPDHVSSRPVRRTLPVPPPLGMSSAEVRAASFETEVQRALQERDRLSAPVWDR